MTVSEQTNASQLALFAEGWGLDESFQDTCVLASVEFRMAGFTAKRKGEPATVTGSACAWDYDPAITAWYELLERISIVTARSRPQDTRWSLRSILSPDVHRLASSSELFAGSPQPDLYAPAKSNGVAMGATQQKAIQHALFELIERHLVLGCWYGALKPQIINVPDPGLLAPLKQEWRIEHYAMGTFTCGPTQVHATATFIWPLDASKPVIYGFGAHSTAGAAVERSLREALQRLCFLHDADPVLSPVDFRPSPDFHQDYFLQPGQQAAIKHWLSGAHYRADYAKALALTGQAYWMDITPQHNFPGMVAQVFMPECLPLMFGRFQPPQFKGLPPELLIHPIV